jgi:methionyl-tRNA synthetase
MDVSALGHKIAPRTLETPRPVVSPKKKCKALGARWTWNLDSGPAPANISAMSKRFYITTAIDYVNGQPHLGHAYEKVVADVIARARRAMGEEVFYLTGLDEHGQKVQQAALAEGKDPQVYCDELAASWQEFTRKLGLSNDDFVRTTQPRHKQVVQAILAKLHGEGQFYKATYRGFYSASAETFLTEKDRLPDGAFDPSWGKVVELEEDNYYFKLKVHQDWMIAHIESHPELIAPEIRRNEVLGFLKNEPLEDLCITRPASRLKWGIPLPFDSGFVTWVWFDALVNYISVPLALGDPVLGAALPEAATAVSPPLLAWPADLHVIGKDILKFHAVYWPIMLKAMGAPLPRQILVHGWWQKDGQKLSKSTGNVVDPVAVIDEWGVDAFRYYLVRELAIGPDGNWTDAGFRARYQAELANGVGNLVNRSLSMIKRYRQGLVPGGSNQLAKETAETWNLALAAYRANSLQEALQHAAALVTRANQYIDQTSPFKIAKDPARAGDLNNILRTLAEVCRTLGILLWPVIPGAAEKLQRQLGFQNANTSLAQPPPSLPEGHAIGEIFPLFPRKDQA